MASPFTFAQDPRLGLLPDNAREAIQKQAFNQGLMQFGAGLLAQADSGASVGAAIGKAAPEFQKTVQETVKQGLLVEDERKKRETISKFLDNPILTKEDKNIVEFGLATDNQELVMDRLKWREKKSLIGLVPPNAATPDSLQKFAETEDFSQLVWRDDAVANMRSGGSMSDRLAVNKHFLDRAARIYGGKLVVGAGGSQTIEGLQPEQAAQVERIASTAASKFFNPTAYPQYDMENAVRLTVGDLTKLPGDMDIKDTSSERAKEGKQFGTELPPADSPTVDFDSLP